MNEQRLFRCLIHLLPHAEARLQELDEENEKDVSALLRPVLEEARALVQEAIADLERTAPISGG